jgi:hypothetical protein
MSYELCSQASNQLWGREENNTLASTEFNAQHDLNIIFDSESFPANEKRSRSWQKAFERRLEESIFSVTNRTVDIKANSGSWREMEGDPAKFLRAKVTLFLIRGKSVPSGSDLQILNLVPEIDSNSSYFVFLAFVENADICKVLKKENKKYVFDISDIFPRFDLKESFLNLVDALSEAINTRLESNDDLGASQKIESPLTGEHSDQAYLSLSLLSRAKRNKDSEMLFDIAYQLLPWKRDGNLVVTSSTLFFALIEWGKSGNELGAPLMVRRVSRFVLEEKREPFNKMFESYFKTKNLKVTKKFNDSPKGPLFSKQLLGDFLQEGFEKKELGIQEIVGKLFSSNSSQLSTRLLDELEIRPSSLRKIVSDSVSTHALSDKYTTRDYLGYAEYAHAICNFLKDVKTNPPLTISIQAPWGGGKTSLMRMIQKELDPIEANDAENPFETEVNGLLVSDFLTELRSFKTSPKSLFESAKIDLGPSGTFPTIWFNAWVYQSDTQVWAGIGEAIIKGLLGRLSLLDREKFLLRLNYSRVDKNVIKGRILSSVGSFLFDYLSQLDGTKLLGIGLGFALLVLFGNAAFSSAGLGVLPAVGLTSLLATFAAYCAGFSQVKKESAKLSLSEYVSVPDYKEDLGKLHYLREDLNRVIGALPNVKAGTVEETECPIILFIDDLDRCSPRKVADVFEAINLFLAGDHHNIFVVLGMDSQIVAAALENAHKDISRHLRNDGKSLPLGWRFMDKFVQLPLVLPAPDLNGLKMYASFLAGIDVDSAKDDQSIDQAEVDDQVVHEDELSENDKATTVVKREESLIGEDLEKRLEYMDSRARDIGSEDELLWLVERCEGLFSHNPRELKRVVNVYRFYMNISLARQSRAETSPTKKQLVNWIILKLAWPEFYGWIQGRNGLGFDRSKGESFQISPGYHFGKIEDLAKESQELAVKEDQLEHWFEGITKLRKDEGFDIGSPWGKDEALFNFYQRLARIGESESIKEGAGKGLW